MVAGRLAYADPTLKVMLIEGALMLPCFVPPLISPTCVQEEQTTAMTHGCIGAPLGVMSNLIRTNTGHIV